MSPGYLSDTYARSFRAEGEFVRLPRSGGLLIARPIPGVDRHDLMGIYPLFCCHDWRALHADLDALGDQFVCAYVVTDPLGDYDEAVLCNAFDSARAFKTHYVTDVSLPGFEQDLSKSHRRLARRALKDLSIEAVQQPLDYLDDWLRLYANLAERHTIQGMRRFSRDAFQLQLGVSGMTMFRAVHEGETVCLDLWYEQDGVAQGHLVAVTDNGYRLRASYASKLYLLRYFADRESVRWVNLGGVAGNEDAAGAGLAHFKAGWSNAQRRTYFCWRVLDTRAFRELTGSETVPEGFFPPYRKGEF